MSLRWQLPVRSPLPARSLIAGVGAWLRPDDAPRRALADGLRARFGGGDPLLTDSGTSSLSLAIRGALARRAGPVALPAWGCYDLATAADGASAEVLLYDLDPATLGPDFASFRSVLSQGAAAVVVVHWFGIPLDMPAIQREADGADAMVIEDAAQAAGGRLDGRPLGSFGPLTVLSFGRGKGWTGGGGGALLAHSPEAARIVDRIRADVGPPSRGTRELAGALLQWLLARPAVYGLPASLPMLGLGTTTYHPPHSPRGMSSASAAAMLASLSDAESETARRRSHAATLLAELPPTFAPVSVMSGTEPGWLRMPLLASPAGAAAAREGNAHSLGVYPGYPLSLADLPGFGARARNARALLPGARTLASRLITLPTHGLLESDDLARLRTWMSVH